MRGLTDEEYNEFDEYNKMYYDMLRLSERSLTEQSVALLNMFSGMDGDSNNRRSSALFAVYRERRWYEKETNGIDSWQFNN